MTLQELGIKHGTDKATRHTYLPIYEKIIGNLRNIEFNLVEIGTDVGNSIRMWSEYFPKANLYGIDENERSINVPRFKFFKCKQESWHIRNVLGNIKVDVVIDDGSHYPYHQHWSYHWLWQLLKKDAYYFIEDLIDESRLRHWRLLPGFRYWANYGAGSRDGRTQRIEDDILILVRGV